MKPVPAQKAERFSVLFAQAAFKQTPECSLCAMSYVSLFFWRYYNTIAFSSLYFRRSKIGLFLSFFCDHSCDAHFISRMALKRGASAKPFRTYDRLHLKTSHMINSNNKGYCTILLAGRLPLLILYTILCPVRGRYVRNKKDIGRIHIHPRIVSLKSLKKGRSLSLPFSHYITSYSLSIAAALIFYEFFACTSKS